ncbi:MAG: hypothetical protein H0T96_02020 [Thermoleophilaceae bacterium]|nr:hypothetical protein [Thermoleophilaceae bacterium]
MLDRGLHRRERLLPELAVQRGVGGSSQRFTVFSSSSRRSSAGVAGKLGEQRLERDAGL